MRPIHSIDMIQGIHEQWQFERGVGNYEEKKGQYATSSEETGMDPKLIVYPQSLEDIKLAVKYAKSNNIAVAVRTGGHQYSGASSTSGENIQLDLGDTFKDDIQYHEVDGESFVSMSVSWDLWKLNNYLSNKGLFVPHGQCTHVGIGGHVQTGGYGQLGRSFGLFGDHVTELKIIDHEGNENTVSRNQNQDVFYALLGGSPGNFGVITHLTIRVHRDTNYNGSYGLKALFEYKPQTIKNLLNIQVEMAKGDGYPRNYDYCVSVLSSSFEIPDLFPEGGFNNEREPLSEGDVPRIWPRSIVVYAQWVRLDTGDKPDMDWFNKIIKSGPHLFSPIVNPVVTQTSMSKLTQKWLFRGRREFDNPYFKRTYLTNSESDSLVREGWVDWVTERIDNIVAPSDNRCWLSAQIQYFGGKYSQFFNNRATGTSYSWRDSTIVCTIDCFYDRNNPLAKTRAEEWQSINDSEGVGPNGKFSKQDRRVFWGSYGSHDLDPNRLLYHENDEKYNKLLDIKNAVDPEKVFSPNTFCIGGQRL